MNVFALLQNPTYPNKIILEKLLCALCQRDKTTLYTHYERELTAEELQRIDVAYHRVVDEQQPIEYAVGTVTFDQHDFLVTPETLIPRPETEYMILAVKDYLATVTIPHHLIDLGTGCGVLGICSLLAGQEKIAVSYFTDISPTALAVARSNIERHGGAFLEQSLPSTFTMPRGTSGHLFVANIFDHPLLHTVITEVTPLLVVANLPYIPEDLFDNNVDITVKKREPKFAFVWWTDGLDRYRKMFDELNATTIQAPLVLFLEMMTRQVDLLRQAYGENWHFEEVQTFHFNIRIVQVTNIRG